MKINIRFQDISKSFPERKTKVYSVESNHSGDNLGQINWERGWRQYVFNPYHDDETTTVFSHDCLLEISQFIKKLMINK